MPWRSVGAGTHTHARTHLVPPRQQISKAKTGQRKIAVYGSADAPFALLMNSNLPSVEAPGEAILMMFTRNHWADAQQPFRLKHCAPESEFRNVNAVFSALFGRTKADHPMLAYGFEV